MALYEYTLQVCNLYACWTRKTFPNNIPIHGVKLFVKCHTCSCCQLIWALNKIKQSMVVEAPIITRTAFHIFLSEPTCRNMFSRCLPSNDQNKTEHRFSEQSITFFVAWLQSKSLLCWHYELRLRIVIKNVNFWSLWRVMDLWMETLHMFWVGVLSFCLHKLVGPINVVEWRGYFPSQYEIIQSPMQN